MPQYLAFLRGINVGGHRVKMDRLRQLFEDLGFHEVSTFIASGNLLFSSESTQAESVRAEIESHLSRELGYEVPTFLRTPSELAGIAARDARSVSSAPDRRGERPAAPPSQSHYVIFLHAPATDSLTEGFARLGSDMDSFEVSGREIHWRIKGKMSESPLFGGDLERVLRGIPNTSRNMNTLRRILTKADSP